MLASCGGGGGGKEPEQASQSAPRAKALAAANVVAPTFAATWTELPNPNYAPPNGPYVRAWTELTWDSQRNEMAVFGGNGPTGYENDIWSYNSTTQQWTTIDPNTFCPGNQGFTKVNGTDDTAFKYDPINNLYWVFGAASGYRCLSYVAQRTAETGSSTTTVVDSTLTGATADAYLYWHVRSGSTDVTVSAYDPVAKTLTLAKPIAGFGPGSSFQLYATTGSGVWYFDPATKKWVGQDTPMGNTGPTPTASTARIAPAVAYSSAAGAMVMFGGIATGTIDKAVWVLDLHTKSWTKLPVPAVAPPHMRELLNSFVYDSQNDVFILFGGVCSYDTTCPDYTLNGDTWVYKLSTNTWTKMSPPVSPAAREQHVMAYDAKNGVVTLFGGGTAAGTVNDTWVYHYPSNTWTQLTPAVSPVARYLAQSTYDPVNGRTVIFGGQSATGERADIWALTLTPTQGAPTVSLTAPQSGASYAAPATVTLSATASDSDGTVTAVDFFAGATKVGTATAAPYTVTWSGAAAGTYTVTAVATDNDGKKTTSAPVTVTVVNNTAPTVSITSPAGGAMVVGSTVQMTASASDSDGSISRVDFYAGSTKVGQATTSPYTVSWTNVAPGNYTLTAVAYDNFQASTTSAPVAITVSTTNQSPSVALTSPAAGSSYTEPATIAVSASASDPDGSVTKVEFYAGATKIGQATSAPYAITWTSVPAGTYSLTAVVTDNAGATTTSSPVAVTVTSVASSNAVNVALQANGGVATASSSYSSNFPVSAVNDGNRRATNWGGGGGWNDATAGAYPDWVQVTFNGQKAINRVDVVTLSDQYTSDPAPTPTTTFSLYGITAFQVQYHDGTTWVTVPGGDISGNNKVWRSISFPTVTTDRIRVVVTGALYQYSRIVEIEAWSPASGGTSNAAPTVSLASPANGAAYTAPATVSLSATAADSDGSVAKVEYFAGATKLGESSTAPYALTVSGIAAGTWALTAVATDNLGLSTTSAAVTITVTNPNTPPTVSIASPASGTAYTAPATISLSANAADADGSVSKVEFYAGTTKIGQATAAPWSLTWSSVPAGTYSITAVATDNVGAPTTSAAVSVVVNAPSSGNSSNVALQANGGVASASSAYSSAFPVASINDGNRRAGKWGAGGGWNDATRGAYPDWVQITFNGTKTIGRIDVFTLPDSYASDTDPTTSTTFSYYGITAFQVQYFDGTNWVTVPGGDVTGNNLVWRSFSFAPVSTDRIRVVVNASLYDYSRIVEVEAWTAP